MPDHEAQRIVHNPAQGTPEPPWPAWLAAAVIRQALVDATSTSLDASSRAGAHVFLAGSEAFVTWCHVAGLDAEHVRRLSARARSSSG